MKSKNCIAVALLVALLSSCMGRMAGGGGTWRRSGRRQCHGMERAGSLWYGADKTRFS